ncbi:MAG: hypothetical protein H6Q17_1895 [Bacteroidetes bacterium]|nr:hypothetical protein [Bacteroidota bacterium]
MVKEADIPFVYGKKPVGTEIFLVTLFVFSQKHPVLCYGLTSKELILSCIMQYNLKLDSPKEVRVGFVIC